MYTSVVDRVTEKNTSNNGNKIKNKKRMIWIDKLRIISMIAVILIHISGNTIETFGLYGVAENVFYTVKHLCFFAIGIFVMISGAMFLNRDISVKDMYKKYVLKILIALITFGAVYSAIEIFFTNKSIGIGDIPTIIKNIVSGDLWAHMWYLYLILALYMVTPIIRAITKNIDEATFKYMLVVLFIFRFVVTDLAYITKTNIAFNIDVSAFLFYYVYGHFLMNYKVSKTYKNVSYFLGIISFVTIGCLAANNQYMGLVSYTSTLVFMCANAIFLLVKNIPEKETKLNKLITSVGKCSFGIYLIHQFFINIMYKLLKFDIILKYPYIGLIAYAFIIATISYITVYLLKKIRIIDKYLL